MNKFDNVLGSGDMEVNIIGGYNVGEISHVSTTQKRLDICVTYRINRQTYTYNPLLLSYYPSRNFCDSGVSDVAINDHCLVYAIKIIIGPKFRPQCTSKSNFKSVKSRCFKNLNSENFQNDFAMLPCHLVEV